MNITPKFAVLLEYEGTHFHGWQIQAKALTVQQVLEDKLAQILGHKIHCQGACRTDAGVHALAQVAHFTSDSERDPVDIRRGLNALTPHSISAIDLVKVPQDFHARYDARGKTYCYRIWNDRVPHPFVRRFCYLVKHPLDASIMKQALKFIEGEHDFSSFRAASCVAKSTVRTIFSTELEQQGPLIIIRMTGNAFLQHMVRIIVGTLIDIGRQKQGPESIMSLLQSPNRRKAGQTVPALGLTLEYIRYEPQIFTTGPRKLRFDI